MANVTFVSNFCHKQQVTSHYRQIRVHLGISKRPSYLIRDVILYFSHHSPEFHLSILTMTMIHDD